MEAKGLCKSESAIELCGALVTPVGIISRPGFLSLLGPAKCCRAVGSAGPPSHGELAPSLGQVVVADTRKVSPQPGFLWSALNFRRRGSAWTPPVARAGNVTWSWAGSPGQGQGQGQQLTLCFSLHRVPSTAAPFMISPTLIRARMPRLCIPP